jgi:hypothetical protein
VDYDQEICRDFLKDREKKYIYEQMFDIKIWKALNPNYSIEETKPLAKAQTYSMSSSQRQEQIALLKEDGYCLIPSLIDEKKIDKLLACIQTLIDKGLPPVYCFVYDLFWQLILEMGPVLSDILTENYLIIPNVWTWHVEGQKTSYFPPHRDLKDEDFIDAAGMPTLFSLWIPLTDVTTYNSCMYVLPASRDPEYPSDALTWRERWQNFGHKPWKVEDLVNIRALPAKKGTFMGWNGGVLHWGSKPHPKAGPRISIGYYFHSPLAKKQNPNLVDLSQPLSLSQRLNIIFNMMHLYGKSIG